MKPGGHGVLCIRDDDDTCTRKKCRTFIKCKGFVDECLGNDLNFNFFKKIKILLLIFHNP